MDLEKLETLAKIVLKHFPLESDFTLEYNPDDSAMFRDLMNVASRILPEYTVFLNISSKNINKSHQANVAIRHLLEIIEMEKKSNSMVKDMKIFESVEEKINVII